jgi:methyl-accepting chemotaxis protein
LLGVSLVPMALMGVISHRASSAALREQAFKQLETVNAVTAKAVERYFASLADELAVLAEGKICRESLRAFTAGLATLRTDNKVDEAALAAARRELEAFYAGEFATEFQRRAGQPVDLRPLCDSLDDDSAYAQFLYMRANANAIGSKSRLDAAADGSAYTKTHAAVHPFFRSVCERYGVADVFLVDAASGEVVYSVAKEPDFVAPLREGPLATSNLGLAVQQAMTAGRRGAVSFGQFRRYLPSCNDPASFLAAPVYDGRTLVGVVAFQVPLDKASAIIGETTGMGRTGETYAIGPDRLFRSESRFTADMGAKTTIINPDFKVDTAAVRAAIDEGRSGMAEQRDYRGVPSLAAWRPVTVHRDETDGRGDVRWALVSEIDSAEV